MIWSCRLIVYHKTTELIPKIDTKAEFNIRRGFLLTEFTECVCYFDI